MDVLIADRAGPNPALQAVELIVAHGVQRTRPGAPGDQVGCFVESKRFPGAVGIGDLARLVETVIGVGGDIAPGIRQRLCQPVGRLGSRDGGIIAVGHFSPR